MAGYIGSKTSVTIVDGYNKTTADSTFVDATGDTMTGNLSFGDNDKAIFGAGSDLQIYHDGSNSLITDTGTGNLTLTGSSEVTIENQARSQYMLRATDGGAVQLYNAGSAKFATTATGIDVTGTVVADGLTVEDADGATIRIQSSDTSVDGGSLGQLEFYSNDASIGGTGVKGKIQVTDISSYGTAYEMNFFTGYVTGGAHAETKKMSIGPFGDISFFDDSNNAKFFWDASAEELQLGGNLLALTPVTTGTTGSRISANGGGMLRLASGGSDKMYVLDSGNVGIGTNAPTAKLDVKATDGGAGGIRLSSNSGYGPVVNIHSTGSDGYVDLYTGNNPTVLRTRLASYGQSFIAPANGFGLSVGTQASPYTTRYKLRYEGSTQQGAAWSGSLPSGGANIFNLITETGSNIYGGRIRVWGSENGVNTTYAEYTFTVSLYGYTGAWYARIKESNRVTLNNGYGNVYIYFSNFAGSWTTTDQTATSSTNISNFDIYARNAVGQGCVYRIALEAF